MISDIKRVTHEKTATIASGSTESDYVELRSFAGGGYALPSTFDGTALSFKVSTTKTGTYQALYDEYGNVVSLTVAASRSYQLPSALFGWPFFKFVAGTSQSTTDTEIELVLAG